MRDKFILLACALPLLMSGCAATKIEVRKAAPEVLGIRYSLPKPFLLVTPSNTGDGSFKVEVLYLPDPKETYAISAETRRGKYKLEVKTQDGLLTKIDWNGEGTALATEIASSTAALAKAGVDRQKTDREAAQKKADDAKEKYDTDVKTLKDTLKSKQLAFDEANMELSSLKTSFGAHPSDQQNEQLREAKLKVEKAKYELGNAQEDLDAKLRQSPANSGAANEPDKGSTTDARVKKSKFYSPMLYAIVDDGKTVKLVPASFVLDKTAADGQIPLDTVLIQTKNSQADAPDLGTQAVPDQKLELAAGHDTVSIKLNAHLDHLDQQSKLLLQNVPQQTTLTTATSADARVLVLKFAPRPAAGEYSLQLIFTAGGSASQKILPLVVK